MNKDTPILDFGREGTNDALTEILREGARKLLLAAVEDEIQHFLKENEGQRLADGRAAVVRNGYLPEREIQTGIGKLTVRVPKVRDRSGNGIKFNSALLPPYLKRTKSVEELLPWLYLKGVSTGDFQEALHSIMGDAASGLSAGTICRFKANWIEEYRDWQKRDLSGKRAKKRWRKLKGYKLLGDVVQGIRFKDGIREQIRSSRSVA